MERAIEGGKVNELAERKMLFRTGPIVQAHWDDASALMHREDIANITRALLLAGRSECRAGIIALATALGVEVVVDFGNSEVEE